MSIFSRFLAHHHNDLTNIIGVLGDIVSRVPMRRQDKVQINDALTSVKTSVGNIKDSVEQISHLPELLPSKDELHSIVHETLNAILPGLIQIAVNEAVKAALGSPQIDPAYIDDGK